tara:strand:- start:4511 stop:5203 length:693 start_codon:yes stop_codon:yes gene_type:complete
MEAQPQKEKINPKDQAIKKTKQLLDRRQLMINLRKLQLQRKSVQQKGNTDMHLQTQSVDPCAMISFGEFISEGGLARAMQKSNTKVTGHISADRGSSEKDNRSKRKGLEKDLKKHGIGHKKGVGEYKYDSGETGREVSYHTSKPDKMSKRRFGKVMRRLGRKHGQESVITKDKDKPAKLHTTEKGSKAKSETLGKSKVGKHPKGYGETSSTKVRSGKLPDKSKDRKFHYG